MASSASSSVSTNMSTRPVVSACSRQPPSSSRSTSSPIAMEISRGLETAMVEPFFITEKSEQQTSQAEEPKDGPSAAAHQGVSRVRWNWVMSVPSSAPMPFEPMASGSRAPVDSPTNTTGMPRSVAMRRIWPTFLLLVALVDEPLTVKSLTATATSRPSIRPKPQILPSAGVVSRSSGTTLEVPSRPVSIKVPLSSR